ncbi:MAG: PilZ domain-containing protein [Candidatus Acidiferrales bacterium]
MADSPDSPVGSATSYAQRRAVPRYSLVATAEIVDPMSGVRISGRISEVSRKGCYVDLLNTLPKNTMVRVRISRDQGSFESPGKIIYVQEGMGMGLAFLDMPPDQLKTLDSWLTELTQLTV